MLDSPGGGVDLVQFDQLRRTKGGFGTQEFALGIAQTQCTDTAEIIDGSQNVESSERTQRRIVLATFCMRTLDDALAPRVWFGVSQCRRERRVFLRGGAAGDMSLAQRQIR